ncbi:MAG TPA: SGNH/GDSL hydrolase family protein [Thermoanaerobaculia bacterium]|nr:SGNH/GDSL hydrolase family protein [Thermoanaerobaculia bacterium]
MFAAILLSHWLGTWIGTWAAAPQHVPSAKTYANQTIRMIVHVSAGGKKVRVRFSNIYGGTPLFIRSAHIARRTSGADVESDHVLTFGGKKSVHVEKEIVSDPVGLDVPPLSDLAISIFLPEATQATTQHELAKQTNYVADGDAAAAATFPPSKPIGNWPFLTGVDVAGSPATPVIVAFGSSLTDGDGSTKDTNHRWPDYLAARLPGVGVLNEGIIGNRLLFDSDSPHQTGGPLADTYKELGSDLGQSGLRRFDRDVVGQAGVRYVILALGVNDILFPSSFIDASNGVTARMIIVGNRQLIARAHKHGIRAIGATMPPFEHALFRSPPFDQFYSAEKENVRAAVNEWIRHGGEFDGVIDFDAVVRDPERPTQILPAFDSGDHLHVNDAGNVAQANAISLGLFGSGRAGEGAGATQKRDQ